MGESLIIDPFDDNDLNLVLEYEKENNLEDYLSSSILARRESSSEDDNEFDELLFLSDGFHLKNGISIHGFKDLSTAYLTLIAGPKTNRAQVIKEASRYAIKDLGMEEVFLRLSEDDSSLSFDLIESGYEDLGNDDYLLEKDSLLSLEVGNESSRKH